MTDLQEVRRYWPRAVTMVSGEWYTAAGLKADLYRIGQVWQVTITTPGDAYRRHCQPTIAEAMRAAGFGRRKPGFHSMLNLKMSEWHRYWLDTLGQNWRKLLWESGFPKTYATRQRPRKGARLGRRKREALRRIEELEAKP